MISSLVDMQVSWSELVAVDMSLGEWTLPARFRTVLAAGASEQERHGMLLNTDR